MGMTRLNTIVALIALCCATASAGPKTPNLLSNGNFDRWIDGEAEPVGWHTRITSVIPIPEYRDPENKKGRTGVYHFKCGCGEMWGDARPWTNLYCPACKQMNTGLEDSGDFYIDNFKYVEPATGPTGRAAAMKIPKPVGDMEGVRIISELMRAEEGAAYEISFDAISHGPHVRVFVEYFKELKPDDNKLSPIEKKLAEQGAEWVKTLPVESNPMKLKYFLKRGFRKHINAGSPNTWTHFSETFMPPERYADVDYMFVSLYGYLEGECAFDNVVLRKLTPQERAAHIKANPGPKDDRLR